MGGFSIKYPLGLRAVSDGDVIVHAICDGILGAAALGDIGDYFPPQSSASRGILSISIVERVLKKIKKRFKIINIDITVIAQKPRLRKYKPQIIASLEKIFKNKKINLKIKSKEGMNILGGVRAISCFAIVLLKSVNK